MGFSWLQPTSSFLVTGDTQQHDGKYVETGNGKHICIVIRQHIETTILCLYSDFSTLLYYFSKSKCL